MVTAPPEWRPAVSQASAAQLTVRRDAIDQRAFIRRVQYPGARVTRRREHARRGVAEAVRPTRGDHQVAGPHVAQP
jgi:hypothetical protein